MREIKESDWKVLRQLHPVALERFCKQALLRVDRINSDSSKSFHQKFLEIFYVTREGNEEIALVFDDLRRSTAMGHLFAMKSRGLLTEEEFSRFSPEIRARVGALLND